MFIKWFDEFRRGVKLIREILPLASAGAADWPGWSAKISTNNLLLPFLYWSTTVSFNGSLFFSNHPVMLYDTCDTSAWRRECRMKIVQVRRVNAIMTDNLQHRRNGQERSDLVGNQAWLALVSWSWVIFPNGFGSTCLRRSCPWLSGT